ncbi:hypothetical protein [Sphingobacterium sp. xlx-130]|uniref:hypothetical protein n=1 Tax=Sphingobacterium sp. xlx-130 TaxID=2654323 RepID=UPI0013DCCA64|nr:hypothetical protein [Sphingobacterium sp. xlx-130]
MDKSKMNNLGINVKINGRQICKAGFDKENFVLTAITSLVHREGGSEGRTLSIGGLDSDASEHVSWYFDHISLDDKITLEVIEGSFDAPLPTEDKAISEESDLQRELERYYQLREELKGYINEE